MKDDYIYVCPKNVKHGNLILGRFHIRDLVILAGGILTMLIGCLVSFNSFKGITLIVSLIIFVLIGGGAILLTTSYRTYHNILGLLFEIFDYMSANKEYKYGGKIYYYEEKDGFK